jgi:hypothetical protein
MTMPHNKPQPSASLAHPYELLSVQEVDTPGGFSGDSWHRYEISQGDNRIVGYRQGRYDVVVVDVEAIVVQLNARRLHQRGRVHLTSGKSGALDAG